MDTHTRRYIFVDFENLKKVKLKKLEKVCDKVYILINAEEESIPFTLVQSIQRLGKGAKWVPVADHDDGQFNLHLSFLMGKLHQKVSRDIQFAILSNDPAFDPLVNYINEDGRSCLRVKRKRTKQEKMLPFEDDLGLTKYESEVPGQSDGMMGRYTEESAFEVELIEETAKDTIDRLVRSGNRPLDVGMLRSYILLHNQELSEHGNVDMIIRRLQENDDITIEKGEVIYNF
ncbi:MAG: PIN domain-containing protein [Bacteroidota bacterium]